VISSGGFSAKGALNQPVEKRRQKPLREWREGGEQGKADPRGIISYENPGSWTGS